MDININSNNHSENKNKKENTIPISEITALANTNTRKTNNLDEDSIRYEKEQDLRDNNLFEMESIIDEKIKFVEEDISFMHEELRKIQQIILILAKNFKNFVKTSEIEFIKGKLDSLKFEELATKSNLKKFQN